MVSLDSKRKKYLPYSREQELKELVGTLEFDMVSLWQIIARGREDFGLSDSELIPYVRDAIIVLVRSGGMPATFAKTGRGLMKVEHRYGTTPETIADALITEWGVFGYATPIVPGGLWFARSEICI